VEEGARRLHGGGGPAPVTEADPPLMVAEPSLLPTHGLGLLADEKKREDIFLVEACG
jgi:hypothetical protein